MEEKCLNKESSTQYEEEWVVKTVGEILCFNSHIAEVWVTPEFYKTSQWARSCILSGFEPVFRYPRAFIALRITTVLRHSQEETWHQNSNQLLHQLPCKEGQHPLIDCDSNISNLQLHPVIKVDPKARKQNSERPATKQAFPQPQLPHK